MVLLLSISISDTANAYLLPADSVNATYFNFKHEFDMNSIVFVRQMDRFPILFDDTKGILFSVGGVAPAFDAISIRGGGEMENGIFVNGIPLFNSPLRFMTFLPLDRDAVSSIILYRGNMPADYEGFLSSVVKIETYEDARYIKVGVPSLNFSINGFYGDFFLPGPFMGRNFQWNSLFFTWKGRSTSSLLAGSCRLFRNILDYYNIPGDTLLEWRECITMAGTSWRRDNFRLYYTFQLKEHYDTSSSFDYATRAYSRKHLLGINFGKGRWGGGFHFHRYDFGGESGEGYENPGILLNRFASVWIFRRFRFGEVGLTYYTQGKLLPIIRLRFKHFLDSTRAITLFAGTSSQGYISFGFPIFERVIAKGKVNYGYTLIAGYEHVLPGFSIQINGFIRYFHPYYVINPLLFPSYVPDTAIYVPPSQYFIDRSTVSAGADLTLKEYRKGELALSLTLLRSFFTDTWTPSPQDVVYVFNFNYRFVNVMWMYGPIRYELILNPEHVKNGIYRESSLYIYSVAFPFRWKGFKFRVGIYNLFPQPEPSDEFSSIYRAFPIPILSVKKEF